MDSAAHARVHARAIVAHIDQREVPSHSAVAAAGIAGAIGYPLHFLAGMGLALMYWIAFRVLGQSSWWLGGLFGLAHVAFAGSALVNVLLPVVHPRIGTHATSARSRSVRFQRLRRRVQRQMLFGLLDREQVPGRRRTQPEFVGRESVMRPRPERNLPSDRPTPRGLASPSTAPLAASSTAKRHIACELGLNGFVENLRH